VTGAAHNQSADLRFSWPFDLHMLAAFIVGVANQLPGHILCQICM
jgi:hypothetical protein